MNCNIAFIHSVITNIFFYHTFTILKVQEQYSEYFIRNTQKTQFTSDFSTHSDTILLMQIKRPFVI